MTVDNQLYELYKRFCEELGERECKSCGGPAQHVDRDGSTFCFECIESDYTVQTRHVGKTIMHGVTYPGIKH